MQDVKNIEYKLIREEQLDVKAFKKFYKKMSWIRVPRHLGQDHADFFYMGTYEDDNFKISAKLRPSKRMSIEESHKGFDKDGHRRVKDKEYKGNLYEFGTSVEVFIDDEKFIEKIKAESSAASLTKTQKVNW